MPIGRAAEPGSSGATVVYVVPTQTIFGEITPPGFLRQSATLAVDLLTLVGVAFCLPFVILAVASPLILCAALVVWIIGQI